jgi:ascorbate-specific PTS system EIIC-type component UlaA
MPERIQRIADVAHTAQTATYMSGATGVGIGIAKEAEVMASSTSMAWQWLEANAAIISLIMVILTYISAQIFRFIQIKMDKKYKDEILKLQKQKEEREQMDFRRRHSDLYSGCAGQKPVPDKQD